MTAKLKGVNVRDKTLNTWSEIQDAWSRNTPNGNVLVKVSSSIIFIQIKNWIMFVLVISL